MARNNAYQRAKGRSGARFVMLLHSLLETAAWRDLSGNGAKLLVHLIKVGSGFRNGSTLHLSEREASAAIGVSRNTVSRAFEELVDHGFLRVVQQGHFTVKTKMATTWRLTFLPADGKGPTHEYKQWAPPAAAQPARPVDQTVRHETHEEHEPDGPASESGPATEPVPEWRRMINEMRSRGDRA